MLLNLSKKINYNYENFSTEKELPTSIRGTARTIFFNPNSIQMLRPTEEQIREHFKGVTYVECLEDKVVYKLDLTKKISNFSSHILIEGQAVKGAIEGNLIHVFLWNTRHGFANIIPSKTKKVVIKESAYAVYPDSIRMDLSDSNSLSAIFRQETHAHAFGKMMWEKFYIVKPVSIDEFLKLEE